MPSPVFLHVNKVSSCLLICYSFTNERHFSTTACPRAKISLVSGCPLDSLTKKWFPHYICRILSKKLSCCILIWNRFTNERHSSTVKTIGLLIVDMDWSVKNLLLVQNKRAFPFSKTFLSQTRVKNIFAHVESIMFLSDLLALAMRDKIKSMLTLFVVLSVSH